MTVRTWENCIACHGKFKMPADLKLICNVIPLFKPITHSDKRKERRETRQNANSHVGLCNGKKWKRYFIFFPLFSIFKIKCVKSKRHFIPIDVNFPGVNVVSVEGVRFSRFSCHLNLLPSSASGCLE